MLLEDSFAGLSGRVAPSDPLESQYDASWRVALAGAAARTGALPHFAAREAGPGTAGQLGTVTRSLPAGMFETVKRRAARIGVEPAEYVFAVYLIVIARMTGAPGALATLRGIEGIAHPLPIFAEADPEADFAGFARSVRGLIAAARRRGPIPPAAVGALAGAAPRFGFVWREGAPKDRLWAAADAAPPQILLRAGTDADGLGLVAEHPAHPVAAERAAMLTDHVVDLLDRDDLAARGPLGALALAGPDLPRGGRTQAAGGGDVALSAAVAAMAATHSDAVAIADFDQSWSYGALERDVARLALALAAAGVGPGTRVALRLGRSYALVAGMLAVNRLDGIFAIFDPAYPEARLAAMDEVYQAEIWLRPAERPEGGIDLGRVTCAIGTGAGGAVAETPDEARYALFTSGTTGQPKCVLASGAGLIAFLRQHIAAHDAGPGTRTALIGGLGHDPFLRDVFVPLMAGGTLHLPPEGFRQDARLLADWLRAREITILHMTPQMSKLIRMGAQGRGFPALSHLFWGGDVLAAADAEAFLALAPNARGHIIYGTTETPQAAAMFRLDGPLPWTSCPIGRGVNGRVLRIEADGRACGFGEPGEIMVEGDDLALGYFDAATGLTAFGRAGGRQRFETRDLGFYHATGDVAFLGRADQQVKIRGFRVEPAEIVKLLERQPGIARAAVVAEAGPGGENRLVGYVEGAGADEARLIAACRRELPDYMVPAGIVALDMLPLTANGKLDRAALPRLDARAAALAADEHPRGAEEQALAAAIAVALNRETVPITRSLRQIGVDSLSFIEVSILLEEKIGALPERWEEIPLRELLARRREATAGVWPKSWVGLDLTVLLRVISIAFVVMSHAEFWMPIATSTLFVVSGLAFAKFQRPVILETGETRAVWGTILKFGVPAALWMLLTDTMNGAHWLPDYFLLGTMVANPANPHYTFWFLDFLAAGLAMMALFYAGVHGLRARRGKATLPARAFGFDLALLVAATALGYGQILTGIWDGGVGSGSTAPFRALPLLMLGVVIFSADTRAKQLIASGLVLAAYALHATQNLAVMGPFDTVNGYFVAGLLGLIWIKRVRVPRILRTPLTIVASSTLFIYIVNYAVVTRLAGVGLGWVPLQLGAALGFGVAVKYGWDWVLKRAAPLKPRIPMLRTA